MPEQTIETSLAPTFAEKLQASAAAQGAELVELGAPVVADVDRIVAALDPIADGAMTIIAQPDVPRNLTITVTDANDSASGKATVRGTDMSGLPLLDVFEFGGGTKTFASENVYAYVDDVTLSDVAGAAAGDTLSVGVGDVIALPKPITNAAAVKRVWFDGALVTPVVATGVSQSGVDVSASTYDGTKLLRVAYKPGA